MTLLQIVTLVPKMLNNQIIITLVSVIRARLHGVGVAIQKLTKYMYSKKS